MFSNLAQKFTAVKASIYTTEADGDTEDDTHICRVLRSYYTEKGRAFPAWLPPDPKAPPPAVIVQAPQGGAYGQAAGRGYGGMGGGGGGQQVVGGGGLSSLFDAPQGGQQAGFQNQSSGSLRGNRSPAAGSSQQQQRHNPFASSNARQQQQQQDILQVQARPLPSQRAGSQQSVANSFGRPDSAQSGGMMSAKDKLKMGFGQKRTASPALSEGGGQQMQTQGQGYNSRGGGGGGRGDEGYQAGRSRGYNSQPPQQQGYNDNYRGGGSGSGGGYDRDQRGGERPFVASNAPWATNEMEFNGGGYDAGSSTAGGGNTGYDRRQGLPSAPSAGRRGPGLPSGPRAPRY